MKIGVLGYGNLAKALLQGITSNGNINKKDITITAKSEKTLETAINNGYNAVNSVSEVFTADLVILSLFSYLFACTTCLKIFETISVLPILIPYIF